LLALKMHHARVSTVSASARKNSAVAVSRGEEAVMTDAMADAANTQTNVRVNFPTTARVQAVVVLVAHAVKMVDSAAKAARVVREVLVAHVVKAVLKEKVDLAAKAAHVAKAVSAVAANVVHSAAKALQAVKADLHAAETVKAATIIAVAGLAVVEVVVLKEEAAAVVDSAEKAAHVAKVVLVAEAETAVRSAVKVVLKAEIPHAAVATATADAMKAVAVKIGHAVTLAITHSAVAEQKVVLKSLLKSAKFF